MGMSILDQPATIKVARLDKRHTGHHWYSHRVTFEGGGYYNKVNGFCAARDWLTEQYGLSREVNFVGHLRDQPKPKWAWQTEYSYHRLYMTAEVAAHFGMVMDRFKLEGT